MRIVFYIKNLSDQYYTGGGTVVNFNGTYDVDDFTTDHNNAKEYISKEDAIADLTKIEYPIKVEIVTIYIKD